MEPNKVLVITGASGFLGTWLADEAYQAGYTLIGLDLRAPFRPQIWAAFATSSLETVDLAQLLGNREVYAVFHLAGGASVGASVSDPYGDFYSLMPGTARLALYLVKFHKQARLFLFSSAAVYGNPQQLPITEASSVAPISPYGAHKATAETLLLYYEKIYGLNLVVFRIFSIYGPGLRKQLIWDVSQRAAAAVAAHESSITLFGTGQESRDFLYVKDLCQAALLTLKSSDNLPATIFNLASGVESTVADAANKLVSHLEYDIEIKFNGIVPKGDPTNWRADISLLREIGFSPRYSLDSGLQEFASWVIA